MRNRNIEEEVNKQVEEKVYEILNEKKIRYDENDIKLSDIHKLNSALHYLKDNDNNLNQTTFDKIIKIPNRQKGDQYLAARALALLNENTSNYQDDLKKMMEVLSVYKWKSSGDVDIHTPFISTKEDRNLISKHHDPVSLVKALQDLADPYGPDALNTQENFEMAVKHNNPESLVSGLIALREANMLTPEYRDIIANHSNPGSLAKAIVTLHHVDGFVHQENARVFTPENLQMIIIQPDPQDFISKYAIQTFLNRSEIQKGYWSNKSPSDVTIKAILEHATGQHTRARAGFFGKTDTGDNTKNFIEKVLEVDLSSKNTGDKEKQVLQALLKLHPWFQLTGTYSNLASNHK